MSRSPQAQLGFVVAFSILSYSACVLLWAQLVLIVPPPQFFRPSNHLALTFGVGEDIISHHSSSVIFLCVHV